MKNQNISPSQKQIIKNVEEIKKEELPIKKEQKKIEEYQKYDYLDPQVNLSKIEEEK